ncbi:uncharacterized protein TNCV_634021 [Trichonephila clavipes]|nr:uncharacterized protein TNCV_634021 [Trichonephila clavipes]
MPQKNNNADVFMQAKSVEAQSFTVGIVLKFGEGSDSSDIVQVSLVSFKTVRSIFSSPRVDLQCRAASWSHCSLYPASNQRAVTKLSAKSKNFSKFTIQTKHRTPASRIPSTIQSPSCHLAECKTPLSSCPSSKTCPDMGLRTVLTVQKPKKATPIRCVPVTQRIAHWTSNLKVVGLNPTLDDLIYENVIELIIVQQHI